MNTIKTILAITTLHVDYSNNKITLGELSDGIEREIVNAINDYLKPYLDEIEENGQGRQCKNCGIEELIKEANE